MEYYLKKQWEPFQDTPFCMNPKKATNEWFKVSKMLVTRTVIRYFELQNVLKRQKIKIDEDWLEPLNPYGERTQNPQELNAEVLLEFNVSPAKSASTASTNVGNSSS